MRRMSDGGEHLRGSDIRSTKHADFAVGIGKRGGPLYGVVAIVGLVLEGIPLALGGVAATDVLHNDKVATGGGRAAEVGFIVFVVRGALKKRRVLAVTSGVVDVGAE